MHRLLARQLKRTLGTADEEELQALLGTLSALADQEHTPANAATALRGLGELLQRVDSNYEQSDRDLDLQSRSLELSSTELTQANRQLREELQNRQQAIDSLRNTANHLLVNAGLPAINSADSNLESLSQLMAELVRQNEENRLELHRTHASLAQQKFALDQHAIVSITDIAGTIIYANDLFCQISGYRREELIGQNHRIVNAGWHDSALFRELWQTICQGQVWHGEIKNKAKDGHCYWVNATIVPFFDDDGQPIQFVAIRTDITARKQAEEEVNQQLHFQKEVLESIPVPIYLKDTGGRYLGFNKAFTDFFQIQANDLLGHTVFDLLPAEQASKTDRLDQELFAQRGRQSYETQLDSGGIGYDVLYHKASLTRPDGTISGLVGSFSDISERKRWERSMLDAKEAAEAANRAKSDFLANMSHEIRTPMNGIIGMTELALDTDLDSEQRDYLETVKQSADALLGIIDDILDFSKIEAGKLSVENIPFNLNSMVASTLKTIAVRAAQKGLELLNEITPETPQQLLGDPGRLRQVLLNLLGNAIKFTEHGEILLRIGVDAAPGQQQVLLHFAVSDSGIGIAPDKQKQIFDAFSQEDSSTTRRFGGTGLGLAISSRLVALMGGRIWVDSEPGQGSVFHFTVGADLDREAATAVPEAALPEHTRVLVVDDNAVNRRILNETLSRWGMQVCLADSGPAALAAMREPGASAFDLIILDGHMPDMDGFAVAETIQSTADLHGPTLMMLSSAAMRGDAERCRELGIAAYLTKPVTQADLMNSIRLLFGQNTASTTPAALVTRHSLRESHCRLNILLAEDHPVNQRLMINLLNKWGHQVTVANNGREALALSANHHFDLVLMDMQMPEMGGLEATRLLRQREAAQQTADHSGPLDQHLPIYALTAAVLPEDQRLGVEAGVDGYLTKPIKQKELLDLLARFSGPPETPPDATPAIDYRAGLDAADADIIAIIGEDFLIQAQRDLDQWQTALAAADWPTLERIAHSLRGNITHFGADHLAQLAATLEQHAHAAATGKENSEEIETLGATLSRELRKLCIALRTHLDQA